MLSPKPALASPENANRDPEYRRLLEMALANDLCLFDPETFFDVTPPEDVLRQTDGWILSRASSPYVNTEHDNPQVNGHMILFPERHIISPDEMTQEDQLMFWKMCKIARDDFGAPTGAVAMRYSIEGRQAAVGSSIAHLHGHIIVPHLDPETGYVPGYGTPEAQPVNFRIG